MLLLISFLVVCHFLADFTSLSTPWMLAAKRYGKPLPPIAAHAAVHAGLMFFVLLSFTDVLMALELGAIQWISHFLIDTWKGRMSGWFPVLQDSNRREYWVLMGFDQLLHHLTILGMVALV